MKYTESRIFTTSQGTEPVTALLLSHGIDNISVDDPNDIKELIRHKNEIDWNFIDPSIITDDDEAIITFYTEDSKSGDELLHSIKIDIMRLKSDEMYGHFGKAIDFGRLYIESSPLKDDWKDLWKKDIHPFKITETITIKPTWESYDADEDELIIEIDPGMAFGTGTHETTRSCAKLLQENIKGGEEVLDVGTGSGILAIVSVLCGAKNVDACDVDPVAVKVAKANFVLNGFEKFVNLSDMDILKADITKRYDIIASNLTSGTIIKMLPRVMNSLNETGKLILSGMLSEEKEKMHKCFSQYDLSVEKEVIDGEWYTVLLTT